MKTVIVFRSDNLGKEIYQHFILNFLTLFYLTNKF